MLLKFKLKTKNFQNSEKIRKKKPNRKYMQGKISSNRLKTEEKFSALMLNFNRLEVSFLFR